IESVNLRSIERGCSHRRGGGRSARLRHSSPGGLMPLRRIHLAALLAAAVLAVPFTVRSAAPSGPRFTVRTAPGLADAPLDGRLLLLVSKDESQEPRFQIEDGPKSQQAFGIDVDSWAAGTPATFEPGVPGYPLEYLRDLPAGTYT